MSRLFVNFWRSWRAAARGLVFAFHSEQNFRIQLLLAALVFAGIWYFPLRTWERVLVVLVAVLVLTMELLNTVVEQFADLLKPRLHQHILVIKDLMAGAVLLTSLGAAAIGLLIFLPHFIAWFK
jgi:diacylglycerol kinase